MDWFKCYPYYTCCRRRCLCRKRHNSKT
uniref:CSON011780 protein n=1 Tax=Culicoides sonorensis TaxID=179676 RepID=A0A336M3Y5_CULSO